MNRRPRPDRPVRSRARRFRTTPSGSNTSPRFRPHQPAGHDRRRHLSLQVHGAIAEERLQVHRRRHRLRPRRSAHRVARERRDPEPAGGDPSPSPDEAAAGGKITVFPNPYRVEARWDQGQLVRDHYLWFTNLPTRCRSASTRWPARSCSRPSSTAAPIRARDARGVYDPRSLERAPPHAVGIVVRVEPHHELRARPAATGSTSTRSRTSIRQADRWASSSSSNRIARSSDARHARLRLEVLARLGAVLAL